MARNSDFEEKIVHLKEWFEENPKLPTEINPILLKRFLKSMFGDIEETKKIIEINYSMRNKHPDVFWNRDPDNEDLLYYREITDLLVLPGLTEQRYKIIFFRITKLEPHELDSIMENRIFFMISDYRFAMPDVDTHDMSETDDLADGDIQVIDLKGYTMRHIFRSSVTAFRTYSKFMEEAFPVRLKAMHFLNCPSFINKALAIFRPFISDEIFKMMHFHTDNLESLYEYVPRDMLPEEYGGKAGRIEDLKKQLTNGLKEKRDYLMDPKQWQVAPSAKQSRWFWF